MSDSSPKQNSDSEIPTQSKSDKSTLKLNGNNETCKVEEVDGADTSRHRTQFPPPCSWYQSHLADARNDMWAYGSLNGIVIVHPGGMSLANRSESLLSKSKEVENEQSNATVESSQEKVKGRKPTSRKTWPEFTLLEVPPDSKVNSISFCKASWSDLPIKDSPLASTFESGMVCIWNMKTSSMVQYNDVHKGNPSLVEWSPRDPILIYTIDTEGNLSVWNLEKNTINAMNFGQISITSIAVSPHEDNILAIGTKAGTVIIIDATEQGKIMHKMRHDVEVFRVSWKPTGDWRAIQDKANFTQPYLISSVASVKSPSIRVWDRHGKDVATIHPWDEEQKARNLKLNKRFVPTSWVINPNTGALALISSGAYGEIIGWSESSTISDVYHNLHTNYTIFATLQCGDILWSFSYEAVIIGWNLRNDLVECVIPTFKGVSSISSSPIDISRLAISTMDGYIRILSAGSCYPEVPPIKPPTGTNRITGKITSLAWHPFHKNLIAFGTDEGVIGVYECKVGNRFAMIFDRRINGVVSTVDFGPHTYTEDFQRVAHFEVNTDKVSELSTVEEPGKTKLMLYVCGGQSVYMLNPARQSDSLINVSMIIQKTNRVARKSSVSQATSEIRWTPDLSYFAVGYSDGRVELYTPPFLQMKCWIKCHVRAIELFSWRRQDFLHEAEPQCRWFATASRDGTARLFNLAQLFSKNFMDNIKAEIVQIISSVATLNGHGGMRVVCLAWSPHDENLLVTVSYDRTAVVWNTNNGSQIARYSEHQNRLVACIFHPSDKYKLITASDEVGLNCSVHVWDYRHYPCCLESKKHKVVDLQQQKADPVKAQLTQGKIILPRTSKSADSNTFFKKLIAESKARPKIKVKPLMPLTSNALINAKHSLNEELRYIVDKTPIRKQNDETSAQLISEGNANPKQNDGETESHPHLSGHPEILTEMSSTLHLGVLGTTEEGNCQIAAERDFHVSKGNWEYATHLSTWLGDSDTIIEQAINHGTVTETLVAVAARCSKKLYYDAVQALANQLFEKGEYNKAVTYLLLIDNVEEAVAILAKKKFYSEAVLLAKIRFPEQLPQLIQIQENWIAQAIMDGDFELACKINCSLKRFDEALSNIEKRNISYAWKGALYVAVKAQDMKKAEGLGVKYLEDRMANGDYTECTEVITEFNFLKWMMPIFLVHENLNDIAQVDFPVGCDNQDQWEDVLSCFREEIIEKWKSLDIQKEDPLYKSKIKSILQVVIPQNYKEALFIISKNITLMLLEEKKSDIDVLAEDCDKLVKTWFDKEGSTQVLDRAIIIIIRKLSSSS